MDKEKWSKRAMTPTFAGCIIILLAAALWALLPKQRPWLELVIAVFGGIIGFGGMGIALYDHVLAHGQEWGWQGIFSHSFSQHTWSALGWHIWPALLASAVVTHWWFRAYKWHEEKNSG